MSWWAPRRLAFLSSVAFISSATVAQGQTLPSREQIELPETTLPELPTAVAVSDNTERAVACPFDTSGMSASIDTVTFALPSGETLPAELAAILQGITPTSGEAPLSQLCDLRDQAARRLIAAGYVAAVTIPPQEITREARAARLTAIPARLIAIETVGDPGPHSTGLAARAERLKSIYPLRTTDLERELLLASDNPGLDVRMSLVSAGTRPGEVIGQLHVTRRSFQILANAQNYGSRSIGRENGSIRAEFYGLTGLADVTFLGASATADLNEQWTVQGGHYFTLDSGLTIGGSLAYAESRPDLGTLDLRAKSLLGAIEAYAPIVRTIAARGTLGGGLEIIDQESNLHGGGVAIPLTRDKLRVAFVKFEGSQRQLRADGTQAFSIDGTLQLRKGLDILDASERGTADGLYFPSNLEGDPTAWILRGGYTARAQSGDFSLLARLDGQFSAEPLLDFEEYSVGNYTIGRGYDPSVTSGDSALGVRLQPSLFVRANQVVIEPYAFADAVRIWNEDTLTTENGRSLVSAGVGARLYFADRLIIDAGWAHPFDEPLDVAGARRAPDRFLLSLTAAFSPSSR